MLYFASPMDAIEYLETMCGCVQMLWEKNTRLREEWEGRKGSSRKGQEKEREKKRERTGKEEGREDRIKVTEEGEEDEEHEPDKE
jgi:hypothetical protein